MRKVIHMTAAGMAELHQELGQLESARLEIAKELKQASAQGDLRENHSMKIAEEKYRYSEDRILKLKVILESARTYPEKEYKKAEPGCRVSVEQAGKALHFKLVEAIEANPLKKRISIDSPLGKALLGKRPGAIVHPKSDSHLEPYKIIEIS